MRIVPLVCTLSLVAAACHRTNEPPPASATGSASSEGPIGPGPDAKRISAKEATPIWPTVETLSNAEAAGEPSSPPFAGHFEEGQILRTTIMLAPKPCYTLVAAGIEGITELDADVQAQMPPFPPMSLARDHSTGPNAVVGGRGGCFKIPGQNAIDVTVVLRATRGSGLAGAMIFAK